MVSKKIIGVLLLVMIAGAALLYSLAPAQPAAEKLTVYSNFAYYEQGVKVDGAQAQFELPNGIDRNSINLQIVNGYVISQYIKEANITTDFSLLKTYVGKEVSVFDDKGKEINGTLLKYDGNAYVKAGNDLYVIYPSYYQLPSFSGNIADENASIVFMINASNSDAKLSYLLDSISWVPDYTLYLNGQSGRLSLYGNVNNDVKDYQNISLTLFYGQVQRYSYSTYSSDYYANAPSGGYGTTLESLSAKSAAPSYSPVAASEYYKFDLGETALKKGQSEYNIFDRTVSGIKKTYEMAISDYYSDASDKSLAIKLSINNTASNGLGIALPAGKVQVIDSAGFAGEDYVSEAPKGEEMKMTIGNAFDVVGSSTIMNETLDECVPCGYGSLSSANAQLCQASKTSIQASTKEYWATVKNKKSESADVVLTFSPYEDWVMINETIPSTKLSQNNVEWRFTVPADSEQTLKFTIKQKTSSYC